MGHQEPILTDTVLHGEVPGLGGEAHAVVGPGPPPIVRKREALVALEVHDESVLVPVLGDVRVE